MEIYFFYSLLQQKYNNCSLSFVWIYIKLKKKSIVPTLVKVLCPIEKIEIKRVNMEQVGKILWRKVVEDAHISWNSSQVLVKQNQKKFRNLWNIS